VKPHKAVATSCLKDSTTARRRSSFHVVDRRQQQAAKGWVNSLTSGTSSFFPVHDAPGGLVCKKKTMQKPALSGTFGPLLPNSARCFSAGMKGIFESSHRNRQTRWARDNRRSYGIREKALRDFGRDLCTEVAPSTRRTLTEVH
jgi:hypothetical protein